MLHDVKNWIATTDPFQFLLDNASHGKVAIVDTDSKVYSYLELVQSIASYIKMIDVLKLHKNQSTVVGILFNSNFDNTATFIACVVKGVNFTVLSTKDDTRLTQTKIKNAGVNFILSDIIPKANCLTLNPNFVITRQGLELDHMDLDERLHLNATMGFIQDAKKESKNLSVKDIKQSETFYLDPFYRSLTTRVFFNNHNGITLLYKASIFNLKEVQLGIINSCIGLRYKENSIVLFTEQFSMLYDIINGIITPLLQGNTVLFNNSEVMLPTTLYCNSAYLKDRVSDLKDSPLREFLLNLRYTFIQRYLLNKFFKKKEMRDIVSIVVTGKLDKFEYFCLSEITNLYVVGEVASYVAKGLYTQDNYQNFSLPLPLKDNVIAGTQQEPGEVYVYAKDSCIHYTRDEEVKQALLDHANPGRIRVGDVGYVQNDHLFIVDKACNVFINDANQITTYEEIAKVVKKNKIFNKFVILNPPEGLMLFVEIDIKYIESLTTILNLNQVREACAKLKTDINKVFASKFFIEKVILYMDPEGMRTFNHKLITRSFTAINKSLIE